MDRVRKGCDYDFSISYTVHCNEKYDVVISNILNTKKLGLLRVAILKIHRSRILHNIHYYFCTNFNHWIVPVFPSQIVKITSKTIFSITKGKVFY